MVSEIAASSLYVEAEMADFDITAVMEIRTIRTNDRTLPITSASFGANFILSSLSYLEMESYRYIFVKTTNIPNTVPL